MLDFVQALGQRFAGHGEEESGKFCGGHGDVGSVSGEWGER
jgi:hypothetical protein